MFLYTIVILISTALCLVIATKPPSPLAVALTGPASVRSIGDIKITAAVTNTGFEPVKVLKYGSVLDGELPTCSFTVSKGGTPVTFTGVKLQRLSTQNLSDSAYTTIGPGQTVRVEHQVAQLYDFQPFGVGRFKFEPVTTFHVVQPDDQLQTHRIMASSLSVHVSDDVARRELSVYDKRVEVGYCDSNQAEFISQSYRDAKKLATHIAKYLGSSRESGGDVYTRYFGNTPTDEVQHMFELAALDDGETRVIYCDDSQAGFCSLNGGTVAYTTGEPVAPEVHVCPVFFNELSTASLCDSDPVDSGGFASGAILRELIRSTSDELIDFGSGCSADQDLAANDPAAAFLNPDNYSCFAAEFYRLMECH